MPDFRPQREENSRESFSRASRIDRIAAGERVGFAKTPETTIDHSLLALSGWDRRFKSFAVLATDSGSGAERLTPDMVFRCTLAFVYATLASTFLILGFQGEVGPCVMIAGIFSSPFVAGGCALLVTFMKEWRAEEQDRRELESARRQRHEADLRLLVLQAQIEPHFLFNTLSSLRALLRENIDQAEALVDAFVAHLRAVLPVMRTESVTSTLSEQLAICASYLDLMSVRLDGRLIYEIESPRSLWDADVPPLVLPTLVENAIKHGIERKADSGRVRIEARRIVQPTGPCIAVSVIDDGAGFTQEPQFGVGLRNVCGQLALRYGDRATVSLLSSRGSTTAMIVFPYQCSRT